MVFKSYYKMPAPQTSLENCVAHNGSLIPIPGRDVMIQAWYQGGVSVFDWTDASHPKEIAFFDRGPVNGTKFTMGGSWSVYWYNGVMVSSEIARGLDIFELTPSAALSQNEIDAAKSVHFDYLNVQGQPKYSWPASFALARAYLDQLERTNGLGSARISAARSALSSAESASGAAASVGALDAGLAAEVGCVCRRRPRQGAEARHGGLGPGRYALRQLLGSSERERAPLATAGGALFCRRETDGGPGWPSSSQWREADRSSERPADRPSPTIPSTRASSVSPGGGA